jgi:acyl carrier protein phosphodiesterase
VRKNQIQAFVQRALNRLTRILPLIPAKYLISRQLLNDCRKREKYLPRYREINELIAHNKDTLLDVLDSQSFSNLSGEEENQNIRYELKRLTSAMYPISKQKLPKNSLQEKLLKVITEEW